MFLYPVIELLNSDKKATSSSPFSSMNPPTPQPVSLAAQQQQQHACKAQAGKAQGGGGWGGFRRIGGAIASR